MRKLIIVALLTFLTSGCFSLPLPTIEGTSGAVSQTGKSYCHKLAEKTDKLSQRYLVTGVLTTVAVGGLVLLGTTMGPNKSSPDWWRENRNTLVLGSGAILAIPATMLLMRSRDTSTASATAGQAMGLDDTAAMTRCLQARTDLVGARNAIADAASKDLADRVKAQKLLLDVKSSELDVAQKELEATKAAEAAEAAPADSSKQAAAEKTQRELNAAKERLKKARDALEQAVEKQATAQ